MIGREAYAAASAQMTGMHIESNNDIRELVISGDMAFCWCDLNVTITLPSGDRVRRVGPVLSVLRRYPDGHWRLARDANMLTVADALQR
jgi:ketosteroid isomerase-like protein